jgi:ACS family glucarate transporter-like MFS transporter
MPFRYLLVCLTFCLSLLLYIDRACISTAKDAIRDEFGFTDLQWGWVMAIFTLGYALAQTPTGTLADRTGPRTLLGCIVALWSVMTAVTGAVGGFVSMMIARFIFGATEAGAFPGLARATFSWYPVQERGLVTGINFSASRLGGAAALFLMPMLINGVGWRNAFYILGGIGMVFALIWVAVFRNEPEEHPSISDDEKEYILANRQKVDEKNTSQLPFSTIISSKAVWLTMIQYFCSNFTFFFALTWLFPHVKETYELNPSTAGLLCALPLIGGALGNWFSGYLVDFLFVRMGLLWSRRIPAIIGFALAAIGLYCSLQMTDATSTILFFTLAVFGADMTLSPSWSYCVDIGGKSAGAVSGTMNMAGNLGSFATALAFPTLKGYFGGPNAFFVFAAVLNVIAIVIWLQMRPDQPLRNLSKDQ